MTYPILRVKTKDGYELHGLLTENKTKTDKIIIHIHGSAGNFYSNNFLAQLALASSKLGYSFLSTNNRGTCVYNIEVGTKYTGAAIEIFEECLFDIDAWIEFALSKGYQNIILEGHSFGTEKVEYYMEKGKYKHKIVAIILLGFSDAYGNQLSYLKKINKKNEDYLDESRKLIDENKPLHLLSDLYANCGELSQSAKSYFNFMHHGSELSKIFSLREGKTLPYFRKIKVPILGVIGDQLEYTIIPINDAMTLMEKENPNVKCFQIKNCPHNYEGKEKELVKIVTSFIKKRVK